jgi:hypothetical protein
LGENRRLKGRKILTRIRSIAELRTAQTQERKSCRFSQGKHEHAAEAYLASWIAAVIIALNVS